MAKEEAWTLVHKSWAEGLSWQVQGINAADARTPRDLGDCLREEMEIWACMESCVCSRIEWVIRGGDCRSCLDLRHSQARWIEKAGQRVVWISSRIRVPSSAHRESKLRCGTTLTEVDICVSHLMQSLEELPSSSVGWLRELTAQCRYHDRGKFRKQVNLGCNLEQRRRSWRSEGTVGKGDWTVQSGQGVSSSRTWEVITMHSSIPEVDLATDDVFFNSITTETQLCRQRDGKPWRGAKEKSEVLIKLFIHNLIM